MDELSRSEVDLPVRASGADAGYIGGAQRIVPDSSALLSEAVTGYGISLERLQAAVRCYVKELRPQRLTPEQALLAVKEFVARIPRWTQPTDGHLPADVTVIDRASSWAIDEYFSDSAEG